jgi:hypothetical protein
MKSTVTLLFSTLMLRSGPMGRVSKHEATFILRDARLRQGFGGLLRMRWIETALGTSG